MYSLVFFLQVAGKNLPGTLNLRGLLRLEERSLFSRSWTVRTIWLIVFVIASCGNELTAGVRVASKLPSLLSRITSAIQTSSAVRKDAQSIIELIDNTLPDIARAQKLAQREELINGLSHAKNIMSDLEFAFKRLTEDLEAHEVYRRIIAAGDQTEMIIQDNVQLSNDFAELTTRLEQMNDSAKQMNDSVISLMLRIHKALGKY